MTERWLEVFGVVTGLLYLALEIRQRRAMWIVGALSSLVYVYVFFISKVYAMMGLNLYNLLISLYGLRQWSLRRQQPDGEPRAQETIRYRRLTWKLSAFLFPSLILIILWIYYILKRHTDSPLPLGDAIVTGISIVAIWALARRIVQHWLFWIVADALSVYLYARLALYPTMLLYICYTILAFVGYYIWKKKGVEDGC